jgi:LPXTG-site transpeptidase (sortase) family protein
VSPEHKADGRPIRRGLWLVLGVVAVVAALVSVAFATGLLGGTTGEARVARSEPAPIASGPSTPLSTPLSAPRAAPLLHRVTPMKRSVPTRVVIPAIGVNSTLMDLGLEKDGTLETPPGAFPAGWFTGAPTPGELGPAIIVGHVRYNTPGVFARLSDMRRGDQVDVKRRDGSTARFRVTRVEHFAKSSFPTAKVYGNIDHAGLRLITCGGLDAKTSVFEENVVVFADLVSS